MILHIMTWTRCVAGVVLLALLSGVNLPAARAQEKDAAPPQLPTPVVGAWKRAGGVAGWMRVNPFGVVRFFPIAEGKPGDMPAFEFGNWQQGAVPKLQAPAVPFALFLNGTTINDEGLKDLLGLKSLKALHLSG